MKTLRIFSFLLATVILGLSGSSGMAQKRLAEYDANDSFFESYTSIVFAASDTFVYYIAPTPPGMTYPGSHTQLGTTAYLAPDGTHVQIPKYVENVRMALENANAYAASHGMSIAGSYNPSNRFPVYIMSASSKTTRSPRTGEFTSGVLGATVYRSLGDWFMMIDPGLGKQDMIMIPIHEYFHLVQNVIWETNTFFSGMTGRDSIAHKLAKEGTAEFFADQPIPIQPIGCTLNASTADQVNAHMKRTIYFNQTRKTMFDSDDDREYQSVFFWKVLAEKAGGASPANQMAKIKEFWDGYAERNYRGESQFIEEVGEVAGGNGRRHQRFRNFFMDVVAATMVQVGPNGFRDDAFSNRNMMVMETRFDRLNRSHYSGSSLPAIASDVAADETEIRKRLNDIATTSLPQNQTTTASPFGFRMLMLGPPDPWGADDANGQPTNPNPVLTSTNVFLLVRGDQKRDDAWQVVGFRQVGGNQPTDRGNGVQFQKMSGFQMSNQNAIDGYPVAYRQIKGLADPITCLWIGVANVDEQKQASQFAYAYAATPTFQEWFRPEGRTTSTVKFVQSRPDREATDPFHPGDELRLEVDLTDHVHSGRNVNITPDRCSLMLELVAPDGSVLQLEDLAFTCLDDNRFRYRCDLKLPKSVEQFGEYTARWTVRSRLKLGKTDKNVDESFRFDLREDRPQVETVIVRKDSEIVYQSQADVLRPLGTGKAKIEVYFDEAMDQDVPAEVELNGRPIEGKWKGNTWWEAEIDVPADDAFSRWKGFQPLSIQATSKTGFKIDSDDQVDGEQPDVAHQFFVGTVPPYVNKISMYVKGEKVYEAEWDGWDGIGLPYDSLHVDHYDGGKRTLNVKTEKSLPAGHVGYLQVYFDVTQPFDTAPVLTIAGKNVPLQAGGTATTWNGKILLEEIVEVGDPKRSIPVEISGADRFGMKLDGDPGTVAVIDPRPQQGSHWKNYESRRGGTDNRRGGIDVWHELGATPEMSLVIVLDASGSMADNNKIQQAKQGINQLLANLPNRVELALVVFSGCGNIKVHGFTRNVSELRQIVNATSAGGGTPLAAAAQRAKEVFLSAAHPRSAIWKCRIFSDGGESCGGDVTLRVHELEQVIAEHNNRQPEPEEEPEAEPEDPVEDIDCNPQTWSINRVRMRDGGLHLDTIYFEKISFIERELPNGSCYVRLKTSTHAVSYIIADPQTGQMRTRWSINSNGRDQVESATSRDGKAAIDRIRQKAAALKGTGKTMAECRAEIDRIVKENSKR